MKNSLTPITLLITFALAGILTPLAAQEKKVKIVPVRPILSVEGVDLYREYCAVCHGRTGKGDGPAAAALKTAPADLTQLTRKNGGKFPEVPVQRAINGEAIFPAHGNKEMPVWGPIFKQMSSNPDLARIRVFNLAKYIAGLQQQ